MPGTFTRRSCKKPKNNRQYDVLRANREERVASIHSGDEKEQTGQFNLSTSITHAQDNRRPHCPYKQQNRQYTTFVPNH